MIRLLPALLAALVAPALLAQENAPTPRADDLRTLRQLLEQQSKQLEMLTQQVARLTRALEKGQETSPASTPAPEDMPPMTPPGLSESPAVEAETAKTEAVVTPDGSVQHVVSKGETLSSIAKHYHVTIGELVKVNKIEDERKLQIGQTLTVPPPKPTETPKQNKL